jgi:hypothetical protein
MLIGALLAIFGSLFAYRIAEIQERKQKTAPDYAKIFLHTGRALTLDFFGIGFLVGLWA